MSGNVPDREAVTRTIFENTVFDLRGLDYKCVIEWEDFVVGEIGDGDRVLVKYTKDGAIINFKGLHVLSAQALTEAREEVLAQVRSAFENTCGTHTEEVEAFHDKLMDIETTIRSQGDDT